MSLEGRARRLTIFIGEEDRYDHKPLATEIVHRAQQAGLAGATVLRGIEGFGRSNHVHTTRILSLSNDLPIVIVIVDEAERIDAFIAELDELVTEGLVIVDDVEIVKYVGRSGEEA
jgi:PII-like signaling protein